MRPRFPDLHYGEVGQDCLEEACTSSKRVGSERASLGGGYPWRRSTARTIQDAIHRKDFSRARRVLRPLVLADPATLAGADLTWARQKLALSTYKDPELQTEDALEEALRLLAMEDLETTEEAETLNLAGAVHKRLWEVTGDQHVDFR